MKLKENFFSAEVMTYVEHTRRTKVMRFDLSKTAFMPGQPSPYKEGTFSDEAC